MKLKLEHLAPYLPYELKCSEYCSKIDKKEKCNSYLISITKTIDSFIIDTIYNGITETLELDEFKPILKSLSDYTDILGEGINMLNIDVQDQIELCDFAEQKIGLSQISYGLYEIMCINHIDFNRLIEKGLATSYNDIK